MSNYNLVISGWFPSEKSQTNGSNYGYKTNGMSFLMMTHVFQNSTWLNVYYFAEHLTTYCLLVD